MSVQRRSASGAASLLVAFGVATSQLAAADPKPLTVFEAPGEPVPRSRIDELVAEHLGQRRIQPARLCSDAVFLRRVQLDVLGTLPTPDQARRFLGDPSPGKRAALIEQLFDRDEFADYWAMKWSDVLRIKAEFPINLWPNAVHGYHRWVRTCIEKNVPYDRFARELLTSSGSNFRVPPVNFYRAVQNKEPAGIADAVAVTFLGERADRWADERRAGLAAFFSQLAFKDTEEWKEQILYFDASRAASPGAAPPTFPDGTSARIAPGQDPREGFADWLVAKDNPWFARNVVNRIWYWLLGRGIIHEPDDIRPDNPPSVPGLLAYLERELVVADYDLRHVYRLILNSTTYQLASIPRSDHPEAAASFASYPVRRLDAEVLIDALCQITGTTESYSSPVPEPFTFIPEGHRSIALADGSITSPFLEMFGRPPRDTGLVSERNPRTTAAQRLHLLNSSHIRRKIEQSETLRRMLGSSRQPLDAVQSIYLTVLSRLPTDDELRAIRGYAESGDVLGQEVGVDLVWALVNSAEFLHRH